MLTKNKLVTSWVLLCTLVLFSIFYKINTALAICIAGVIELTIRDFAYEKDSIKRFLKNKKILTIFIVTYTITVMPYIVYLVGVRETTEVSKDTMNIVFFSLSAYLLPVILHEIHMYKHITSRSI